MKDALIYSAMRTPRGKGRADGALYPVKPVELIAGLLKTLQERLDFDTALVDDLVLGCVSPVGEQGANIAKTAAMVADWDQSVAGMQVNRFCASGLEAVNLAAMKLSSGAEQLVVAGGVESMSRVPMLSDGGAWALDPATNMHTHFIPQGISADLIATREGFSREQLDQYGLQSQQRAARAWREGLFADSIVPVYDRNGHELLALDELVRGGVTAAALADLRPAFAEIGAMGFDQTALRKYSDLERVEHLHTAGTSSGIADGAAVVLMGTEQAGHTLDLLPKARIVATAVTATDPTIMLTGPSLAARKALGLANMQLSQIDLFEVNEAFAAVVLKFCKDLDVDPEKVNVNGGAIAMGHPLGATGAMLMGTLLDELERRQLRYGMVTLCVGAGMGIATIIERI